MKRLLLAGIGSLNPGDELGWEALEQLQAKGLVFPGYQLIWRRIEHPAVDLLPALCSVDAAVLLDALAESGPDCDSPICILQLHQLQCREAACSSHAFSVAEVLNLAASVGRLPEPLLVLGLQGDSPAWAPFLRDRICDVLGLSPT